MNNTLEIINWEARLSGNMKISKMIESLSVLMNAAMDRKRRHVVPLKEELQLCGGLSSYNEREAGKQASL